MITEPIDRYSRIGTLIESFAKADLLSKWDMKVNENFAQVKTKQLYHVKVLDPKSNSSMDWQTYEKKRLLAEPLILGENQWAVVYS